MDSSLNLIFISTYIGSFRIFKRLLVNSYSRAHYTPDPDPNLDTYYESDTDLYFEKGEFDLNIQIQTPSKIHALSGIV